MTRVSALGIGIVGAAALLLRLAAPGALHAQGGPAEYQLRLLAHGQFVPDQAPAGLAAWAVLPDVTNNPPTRALLLAGIVFRSERRWLELMAGYLLSSHGPPAFELDARALTRSAGGSSLFLELEYNFHRRRLLVMPNATVPLRVQGLLLRIGAESDLVFGPGGTLVVAGPRVVVPIPVCARLCRELAVTTAYRLGSDGQRVLRQYVGLTF